MTRLGIATLMFAIAGVGCGADETEVERPQPPEQSQPEQDDSDTGEMKPSAPEAGAAAEDDEESGEGATGANDSDRGGDQPTREEGAATDREPEGVALEGSPLILFAGQGDKTGPCSTFERQFSGPPRICTALQAINAFELEVAVQGTGTEVYLEFVSTDGRYRYPTAIEARGARVNLSWAPSGAEIQFVDDDGNQYEAFSRASSSSSANGQASQSFVLEIR